jgi:glycosyltransferase involved in cell wall biosynthesis
VELARAMANQTPTRILSFGPRRRTLHYGGTAIEVYPQFAGRSHLGDLRAFGFLPLLHRADVLHCHQFNYLATSVAILLGALLQKPIFVTDLGGRTTLASTNLQLARLVCRFLHLTEFAATWTKTSERSTLIFGGVDTDRFALPASLVPRDRILYVGRILPHKAIDVLIRAAGDDIPLTIAGRPYYQRYYDDLQSLAQGTQVQFITDADDARILDLYQRAQAIVLPSVYTDMYGQHYEGNSEFLGLTLLEGMACGAPAICTNVGGMPEIVRDGVTGFVVPPHDPATLRARLLQLRENPDLVAAMGERAAQEVRDRYTWEEVADRCLTAYRQYSGPQAFSHNARMIVSDRIDSIAN